MATLQAVFAPVLTFAPGAVAGLPALRRVDAAGLTFRLVPGRSSSGGSYVGTYAVAGTVTINTVAARRKVRLYRLNNGQLVDETWSASDGSYRFAGLELAEYVVWSEDYARQYDPVSHLAPVSGG